MEKIKLNRDIVYFAKTNFRNMERSFGIRREDRRQHVYVIGKTGTGKTTLLKNMALQDIYNGDGLAIIDPHGDFVEEVVESIPSFRINDVVYFNPADVDYPIAFNVLEVPDPKYKHLVASGLIGIFTKIWANVWSARMEYILSNCILALLDTPGTTLLGIMRMLVDRNYRQEILKNVTDPVVKSFWINEYEEWRPDYRNEAIAPIQNKVGQFLNVYLIRNIVGQSKSTLNLQEIMDTGKILLANLSKGRVGEDNSALLGAMLITKLQLHAMERIRIPEANRKDFYLYVDEFQNFATESFASILSEARKYRLNLIISHQYTGQLVTETTSTVRDAVFGNVGTLICFRVGAADAEFLEKEFAPEFKPDDLVTLPNYNIYIKLMINGITSRPFSAQTLPPIEFPRSEETREKVIKVSRERYARRREVVEEKIAKWAGMIEVTTPLAPKGPQLYDATCSNCKKKIKVPFKPDEKRPVYCESCLKKAKAVKKEKGIEIAPELAELGIEFETKKPPAHLPKSSERFASLKDLKSTTPEKRPFRPSKNSENLKKELEKISKEGIE